MEPSKTALPEQNVQGKALESHRLPDFPILLMVIFPKLGLEIEIMANRLSPNSEGLNVGRSGELTRLEQAARKFLEVQSGRFLTDREWAGARARLLEFVAVLYGSDSCRERA